MRFRISIVLFVFLSLLLGACENQDLRDRGRKALELGDHMRAIRAWSALLDMDPADHEARFALATALFSEARSREQSQLESQPLWDSCAQELRILLRTDSGATIRGMASTALFHQARGQLEQERFRPAQMLLDQALALDSSNGFAWNLQGLAYEGTGDTARARLSYEGGIARQGDLVACYVNLGNLHWREKRVLDAWEIWSLGYDRDTTNAYLRYWRERAERKLEEMALQE